MYKVYYRVGTGSMVVESVLEEIGENYVLEEVLKKADGGPSDALLKINPQGRVPVVVTPDGTVMTESAAIVLYLADKHQDSRLSPPLLSPLRPVFLRWLLFLATGVYNSDLLSAYSARYTTDHGGAEGVRVAALNAKAAEWRVFADALAEKPYVLGDDFSAVDIYAAMLVTWNDDMGSFFRLHPNVKRLYDRVIARPAVARVWKRHGF